MAALDGLYGRQVWELREGLVPGPARRRHGVATLCLLVARSYFLGFLTVSVTVVLGCRRAVAGVTQRPVIALRWTVVVLLAMAFTSFHC